MKNVKGELKRGKKEKHEGNMLSKLKDLYCLLNREQRKSLLKLQILVIFMAIAEVASVVAIGSFMTLIGDIGRLEGNGVLARVYMISGFSEPSDFLFWAGFTVLLALIITTSVSMVTVWRLSLYGQKLGAELSVRLFKHYMHQPWLFHTAGSSSILISRISQECRRVTDHIISPLMQMNSKIVMAFFMGVAIFIYNPKVAAVGVGTFAVAYVLLYRVVRRRLAANGRMISRKQRERFQIMAEGFGGIKDVLLLGRQGVFNGRFEQYSLFLGRAKGLNKALSQLPRYAMELVAFGTIVFLVLYLLAAHEGNLGAVLPILSVYALAGLKLLPAFQTIYTNVSTIRGDLAGFDSIRKDLYASRDAEYVEPEPSVGRNLVLQDAIELRDVTFHYPGKAEPALNGCSLSVPVNQVIGLVGPSGSGKSTAVDVLIGLLEPEAGELVVNGEPLAAEQKRAWQNSLGFVSQSIFLADASIRENIAFGLSSGEIDEKRVNLAATMAHLDELLENLPNGLDTRVGERGVQLSGGQRQRIGIARALYDDAKVLILDEATSALDGITEKLVMDAIHDFYGEKTIIMIAHRLATVKNCDCIYLMEAGQVVDHGTYEDLLQRNVVFQRMQEHA